MKRAFTGWEFGQGAVLAICLVIVLVAAIMTPSNEMLSVFGVDVPVMCTFRRMFGISCPGCGLTRSFVFMMHGRPIEAFHINYVGPVIFAVLAGQVPYRAYMLYRGPAVARRKNSSAL